MSKKEVAIEQENSSSGAVSADPDPITTQVIRNSLIAAGTRMRNTIIRTAASPSIYDMMDFSAAVFDRKMRLLAQAESMPLFMSTLSYCVKAAVDAIGGEEQLEPGDVLLYNKPYETGTHANDVALITPVFLESGALIGFAAVRAHWIDIGGQGSYSSNTQDIFQEGIVYPGVKVYSAGKRNEDIFRMIMANSRIPKRVAGDMHAEIVGCKAGASAFIDVVERFGLEKFDEHVEHMFNAGEAYMRSYIDRIPDGRYVGTETVDNNGIDDEPVQIEVVVEVQGSDVRIDYSNNLDAQPGPINSPLPGTISISRIAMCCLAGKGQLPNEGFFRPVEVITRPGSMFHPLPPSPCFMYAWPQLVATEAIFHALADALPNDVPAGSGADFCIVAWWGAREATGIPWSDGLVSKGGMGADAAGDGYTGQHVITAGTQQPPVEVWEVKNPWLFDKLELAPDSCGAGQFQGGLGIDTRVNILEHSMMTNTVEHTKTRPWGLKGGETARSNCALLQTPEGEMTKIGKVSAYPVPKGSVFELRSGGGGGYGPSSQRDPAQVHADVRAGYISESFAREHYAHAFLD